MINYYYFPLIKRIFLFLVPIYITYLIMNKYLPISNIIGGVSFISASILQIIIYKYILNIILWKSMFVEVFFTFPLKSSVNIMIVKLIKKYLHLKSNTQKTNDEILDSIILDRYNMTNNQKHLQLVGSKNSLATLIIDVLIVESLIEDTIDNKAYAFKTIMIYLDNFGVDNRVTFRE